MIEQIILTIVGVLLTTFCGGLQIKMRKIETDLDTKMDKADVRELIEDKLAVSDVRVHEIKEDLLSINSKLDRLLMERQG